MTLQVSGPALIAAVTWCLLVAVGSRRICHLPLVGRLIAAGALVVPAVIVGTVGWTWFVALSQGHDDSTGLVTLTLPTSAPWPPTVQGVLGLVLSLYAVALLCSDIQLWRATTSLYGASIAAASIRTLGLAIRSRVLGDLIVAWGLAVVMALPWISEIVSPYIQVPVLLICAHLTLYQATPPTVLLLGASHVDVARLRYEVERGLHPYRVIALLDGGSASELSSFERELQRWDSLRTLNAAAWRKAVDRLAGDAPIIVIDARHASANLADEIAGRRSKGQLKKALVVTQDDGTAPALAEDSPAALPTCAAAEVVRVLRSDRRLTRVRSPNDSPFLRDFRP